MRGMASSMGWGALLSPVSLKSSTLPLSSTGSLFICPLIEFCWIGWHGLWCSVGQFGWMGMAAMWMWMWLWLWERKVDLCFRCCDIQS
ncbi:hypothetical protein CIPAW_09G031100 [Carya illinoinensis]|uniref:Uncharacterized protein n=1 Tax=Carya illinoinensis TaxID=32201 RepID=A0A8T1PIB5_CARIL|nr:hypothetical protein CIPAW_09G031100 [Carya illinoinensis]